MPGKKQNTIHVKNANMGRPIYMGRNIYGYIWVDIYIYGYIWVDIYIWVYMGRYIYGSIYCIYGYIWVDIYMGIYGPISGSITNVRVTRATRSHSLSRW